MILLFRDYNALLQLDLTNSGRVQLAPQKETHCLFLSCAATLHVIMFFLFFCPIRPTYELTMQVNTQTHKHNNQTKLKSILMDLIWLKELRNYCTVPYLFTYGDACFLRFVSIQRKVCEDHPIFDI